MKLGAENRKEVIAAVVLGAVALFTMTRMFWTSSSPAAAPVASQVPTAAGAPERPATRRSSGGRAVKITEPRLDPTLDLDLLQTSEQIKYAGNARNIFVAGSEPRIEPVRGNVATDRPTYTAPIVQPPPPIPLKFFGFANRPGEPKRIFLSQNEDVFIAAEGDIVNRRYRVLRIAPNSVEIEDVLNSNRQSIPLTQG